MSSTSPRSLLIAALFCLVVRDVAGNSTHEIRIRLFERERPTSLELVADGGLVSFYIDNASSAVAELADGERVSINAREDELYAAFQSGAIYALTLRAKPAEGALLRVTRVGEEALTEERNYDGALRLSIDPARSAELLVINETDLETYVAAVLDREYGLGEHEGAKAMAVAIRTYALRSRGRFDEAYDHVDHESSQVFRGVGSVSADALRAARETAGEVLTYGNELIEAVYFASSGGHTADNDFVWTSAPLPYLRGKPDPFDDDPEKAWQSTVSRARLLESLSARYGAPVEGFLIEDRSKDGRVRSVALVLPDEKRQVIRGIEFRRIVNETFGSKTVKSTNFTAVRRQDSYLFEGVGHGHGVGMAQWGAYGMARRGRDYRDILSYYYTGVRLARIDELAALNLAPAVPPVTDEHHIEEEPAGGVQVASGPSAKDAAERSHVAVEPDLSEEVEYEVQRDERPDADEATSRRIGW